MCLRRGRFKSFRKILEYCWMFGRDRREVIERFIDACRQARGRDVVAQYPPPLIHHLSKETRLGSQLMEHISNVVLPFGGERLLVSRSSAKL